MLLNVAAKVSLAADIAKILTLERALAMHERGVVLLQILQHLHADLLLLDLHGLSLVLSYYVLLEVVVLHVLLELVGVHVVVSQQVFLFLLLSQLEQHPLC